MVPALDNYPHRNFIGDWELVVVAYSMVDGAVGSFNCGVVDLLFSFGAPDAARSGIISLAGV